jgi:hypothetical protein
VLTFFRDKLLRIRKSRAFYLLIELKSDPRTLHSVSYLTYFLNTTNLIAAV